MKNILAENMRRFGTKNLAEAASVTKTMASSLPQSLVGRTVTLWTNKAQTGDSVDCGIAKIRRVNKNAVAVVVIDLSDAELVDAYNAGKSVTASAEFLFYRGDTKLFMNITGEIFYNRWLVAELTKEYFSK